GLKPGDFVSYYAKASDNDAVAGSKTTTSDIYFVQIRPFKKDYKAAQSMAGMGGGGGGAGGQVGQLSQQQREIVAATFNTVRDKLANQYEMQQRAEQQGSDKQVDELVEKLKELARRQQQEAERQRRLSALNQPGGGGGGSDSQRQLAKEVEEAARRLEQLTR